MGTFSEEVATSIRGGLCALLAASDGATALVNRLSGVDSGALNIARALRRQLCSDDPDNDPVLPPPPFTGGQCVKQYNLTLSGTRASSCAGTPGPFSQIAGPIWGPIAGAFVGEDNCPPGATVAQGNINIVARSTIGGSLGPLQARPIALNAISVSISNVTVVNGTPDDCGDPPPILPPPLNPITYDTDVTYNIDGDTNITVPLTAVFSPIYVALDGTLRVPVNVDVGGVEFTGNVEISPNFEVNIRPRGITDGPGGRDGGDDGGGADDPVPVPEEEEENSPIIGVLVFSAAAGTNKATLLNSNGAQHLCAANCQRSICN